MTPEPRVVCSVVTFGREQAGVPQGVGRGPNPMTPALSEGCPSTPGTEGSGRSPPSSPLAGDLEGGHGQSQLRPRTAAVCLRQTDLFLNLSLGARSEFPRMERDDVPV